MGTALGDVSRELHLTCTCTVVQLFLDSYASTAVHQLTLTLSH